jgi:hypothetical protein
MMTKTKNEINEYQKIKYQERKAKQKFIKNLLTSIIIVLAVLFFAYASDVRGTNEKTADTVQGIRDELNSLRKDIQDQFNATGQKLLEQDKKIEGVKQSKVEAKKAITLLQNKRPAVSGVCEQYRPLVAQYQWNVEVALAVMKAESGCNPNAANWNDSHAGCRGSFGLFQIACFDGQVYDPAKNVAIAFRKYQARKWQPWGVCTRGIVRCI